MTRDDREQTLLESSEKLLKGDSASALTLVLLTEFGPLQFAYAIDHIPEQGEDIYTVVVGPDTVAIVEIAREDAYRESGLPLPPPIIERFSFKQFRATHRDMGTLMRRALDAAERLAKR